MMGKRATMVLLLLFFGGLGALWWARTAGVPTADERQAMAGRVLPELLKVGPEEIARIELEDPSQGERIALERRGADWQIVEPIDALANTRRAEILLANLKALPIAREAGRVEGEAARFGLEPPVRVIRLYRSGDQKPVASLALGDELERLRYVRPEGGAITLADALRVEPNEVDPLAWRERGLFDIYSYDVKSLNVVGPGRRLNVVLDGGRWRIVHPFRAPASAEAMNGLLADLAELEAIAGAEGFAAEDVEDLSPFGLDPENATIVTLLPAGLTGPPEPQMAYLGGAPEGRDDLRFARRDGQDDVLLVRPRGVAHLGLDPNAVRSRKVVDFRPTEAEGMRIEANGHEYRLARGDEGWRILSPSEGAADALDVAQVLETLVALESAEFFATKDVTRSGLDEPAATVAVWLDRPEPGADDGPLFERPANATLKIGRFEAERKLVYGQLDGDDATVLALPETVLAILPEGPYALRDRTVVRQDPRTVRRVELTRGTRSLALERLDPPPGSPPGTQASWQVVEPETAPADRLATIMLIEGLARLRAEQRVGEESEDESYGFESPAIRVSWEAPAGEGTSSTRTLEIGNVVEGRPEERYARIDTEPGVFTVGPKFLAMLAAEFRERRLMAFPVEQAARIAVRGKDGEVVFVREESGGWVPEAGEDTWPMGYTADRVEALAASLSELTAEQIVQDDGPMPEGSGLEDPSLVIEVRLRDPEGVATVRLGATGNGLRFAAMKPEGPGSVFLVPAEPFALPDPGEGEPNGEQP